MKFAFGVYVIAPDIGFTLVEPLEGAVVTVTEDETINPSLSTSFDKTLIANGVSSFVIAESLFAIGASLIRFTVIKMVAFEQSAGKGKPLSQIETTTVSLPLKFVVGVYVNVPSVLITIVPWFGATTGVVFTVNVVPSGSESPAFVKSPVAGVSSFVVMFSSSTIGASFTGFTVMKIVSLAQIAGIGNPLSQIDTTTVSVPLKFAAGVYVYVPLGLITIVP